MNTVSSVGSATDRSTSSNPRPLGGGHDARDDPLGALDVQLDAAVDHARARHSLDVVARARARAHRRRPSALTVTIVSAPTDCLSAAGVSSARILP